MNNILSSRYFHRHKEITLSFSLIQTKQASFHFLVESFGEEIFMKGQSLHLCSALFLHTCHPMYVHCPSATHWIKAARTVPSTNNLFLHPPFRSSCLSFNKRIKLQVFHSWKLSIQATTQEMARKTCLALVTLVWCFVSPALAYDENMESALVPIVQVRTTKVSINYSNPFECYSVDNYSTQWKVI